MDKNFVKNATFKITQEQIDKIRPYLSNVEDLLGDIGDFQIALDDVIIGQLDDDYNATPTSIMLQRIYDEIYIQNEKQ